MEVKRRLVDQKDVDGIIYAKEISFAFHFSKVSLLYEGTRLMFQLHDNKDRTHKLLLNSASKI